MTHQTVVPSEEKPQRLPCRGCMSDCPNYATCDGTPWRADKKLQPPLN